MNLVNVLLFLAFVLFAHGVDAAHRFSLLPAPFIQFGHFLRSTCNFLFQKHHDLCVGY